MAENTYCRQHIDSLSDELMVKIFSMVDCSTKLKSVNRYEMRMSGGYKFSSDDYDVFLRTIFPYRNGDFLSLIDPLQPKREQFYKKTCEQLCRYSIYVLCIGYVYV